MFFRLPLAPAKSLVHIPPFIRTTRRRYESPLSLKPRHVAEVDARGSHKINKQKLHHHARPTCRWRQQQWYREIKKKKIRNQ